MTYDAAPATNPDDYCVRALSEIRDILENGQLPGQRIEARAEAALQFVRARLDDLDLAREQLGIPTQ